MTCGECKHWRFFSEGGPAGMCVEIHGARNSKIRSECTVIGPAIAYRDEGLYWDPPCCRFEAGTPKHCTPEQQEDIRKRIRDGVRAWRAKNRQRYNEYMRRYAAKRRAENAG
jgi:hypothetical protein